MNTAEMPNEHRDVTIPLFLRKRHSIKAVRFGLGSSQVEYVLLLTTRMALVPDLHQNGCDKTHVEFFVIVFLRRNDVRLQNEVTLLLTLEVAVRV